MEFSNVARPSSSATVWIVHATECAAMGKNNETYSANWIEIALKPKKIIRLLHWNYSISSHSLWSVLFIALNSERKRYRRKKKKGSKSGRCLSYEYGSGVFMNNKRHDSGAPFWLNLKSFEIVSIVESENIWRNSFLILRKSSRRNLFLQWSHSATHKMIKWFCLRNGSKLKSAHFLCFTVQVYSNFFLIFRKF